MDKLLTREEVGEILGIAPSTISNWLWKGKPGFPRPFDLGRKSQRWRQSDIANYIDRMASDRDASDDHTAR